MKGTMKQQGKTQLKDYVSAMIRTIGVCDDLEEFNPEFYELVCSVLRTHPNPSRMDNVAKIGIKRNEMYKHLELFVMKDYGIGGLKQEDISWTKCRAVTGAAPRSKLLSALRHAVSPQVAEFKEKAEKVCVQCGGGTPFHVDHIYPFSCLVKEFRSTHPTPTVFTDEVGNQLGFGNDKGYAEEWCAYHRDKARLQLLCASCNLKKGSVVLE